MMVYIHESIDKRLASGVPIQHEDIEATIEGAVQRLRPKLMTVTAVLASLIPILWESGIGSDVMKPIAAPIVGGTITSTIHVLILVPVFFALMKGTCPSSRFTSFFDRVAEYSEEPRIQLRVLLCGGWRNIGVIQGPREFLRDRIRRRMRHYFVTLPVGARMLGSGGLAILVVGSFL